MTGFQTDGESCEGFFLEETEGKGFIKLRIVLVLGSFLFQGSVSRSAIGEKIVRQSRERLYWAVFVF